MTRLLLSADNTAAVEEALQTGADIVDIAAADEKQLISCLNAAVSAPLRSITGSLPEVRLCSRKEYASKIDFFRVKAPENASIADWAQLQSLAQQHKIILLLAPALVDFANPQPLLQQIQKAGLYGVMLDNTGKNPARITRQHAIEDIGRFIHQAQQHGLLTGVSGALEGPDVPRLLPSKPDIIGFSIARISALHDGQAQQYGALIRTLVPQPQQGGQNAAENDLGTDRILVRDFILPVQIGAYEDEHGHTQRVCFNVAADIARVTLNPEDMRHIFSYDLILDGIRMLVSLGHVALVETLAEQIAALILAYPRVKRVMVRVEKLDLAPKAIGVEIIRERK